jgi:hypothetical protein
MARLWGTALGLALFAAAMWFAWLGWDHQYYEVNGVAQGPYRAWQVVGCGLTIVVATILAYLRVPRTAAIFVLAAAADIGFAVPWGVDASDDETGLWVVGLVFLLVGSGLGLALLLVVTDALAKPVSPTGALVVCAVLTLVALLVYFPVAVLPLAGAALIFFRRWLPQRRARQEGSP